MPGHPPQRPLDDPASWENHEGCFGSLDDIEGEVEERCLVHQLASIVSTVCEKLLDPGPLSVESIEHGLRSRTVGDVGEGEMSEQQTPRCVDGDVALAPHRLLGSVITAIGPWSRRLDGLAVQRSAKVLLALFNQLAIELKRVEEANEGSRPTAFSPSALIRSNDAS
jgi:hypothetical protein